jgi:hypothetical protein
MNLRLAIIALAVPASLAAQPPAPRPFSWRTPSRPRFADAS